MNTISKGCFVLSLAALLAAPSAAQFNSGSDGSDGSLILNAAKTINLAEATTGSWQDPSPSPGKGIYDPDIWAVIYKYTTVNIGPSAVVTFENHESGAPVIWLVQGDVFIDGIIDLNGKGAKSSADPFEFSSPGPGGFQGGSAFTGDFPASAGFGPGGGAPGASASGGEYAGAYGHAHNVLLIGGSGGGGNAISTRNGGGGGGAILIAASGAIHFGNGGLIRANGGGGTGSGSQRSGGGSGGAIRLMANTVTGSGNTHLQAIGLSGGIAGGPGRVRIEAYETPAGMNSNPFYTFSGPGPILPPAGAPFLRAASIGGVPIPSDPKAGVDLTDVIVEDGQALLVIEAVNVPAGTSVLVHIRSAHGSPAFAQSTPLQHSGPVLTATALIALPDVPVEIQLEAVW